MNRKRVLWPLLLAGAFALGVLAAHVQAAGIFLPLVARASTPQRTPIPTPDPLLPIHNVYYNEFHTAFYGELVNETGCTISAPTVVMYLLDTDALPMATMTGHSMAPLLAPGERTPFVVPWYGSLEEPYSYVIYPQYRPVDRLTVENIVFTQFKTGIWSMHATIRNQLPVPVESISVGVVGYGPSGEVVGYHAPRHVPGPLQPGETLTIQRTFYWFQWGGIMQPSTCAAFAVPSEGL